jgi:Flp pilus assembly protein CpaB
MLPVRVRRLGRLRYRPVARWGLVALLAIAVAITSARLVDRAAAARASWGETATVVVVTRPVHAGRPIRDADVERRDLPRAVLPDAAVTRPPVGRVAIVDLFPGEILVARRLAPEGLRGPAALLPPGTRALAVPTGPGTPPLTVGDAVEVLAAVDPLVAASEPASAPPRGRVVAVEEGSVTVALPAADTPVVAFALAQGVVTLALAGAEEED